MEDKNNSKPKESNYSTPPDPGIYPQPTMSEIKAPKNKKKIILFSFISILVIAVATLAMVIFMLLNKDEPLVTDIEAFSPPISNTPAPTPLEAKLTPKQLEALNTSKLIAFLPKNQELPKINVLINPKTGSDFISYGVNIQFGQGITPGSYAVYTHSNPAVFNPPDDCGAPAGKQFASSQKLECYHYVNSDKNMPAYIYDGQALPGITNTAVNTYSTMYVKRGENIIAISSADTGPDVVYKFIKGLEAKRLRDLPSSTDVYLD